MYPMPIIECIPNVSEGRRADVVESIADAIRSVELIAKAIADSIAEARREAPVREEIEEGEQTTYSSDRGTEPAAEGEGDRKRRRRPRRRRAKPDAIAARIKGGPETGAPDAGDAGDAGDVEAAPAE